VLPQAFAAGDAGRWAVLLNAVEGACGFPIAMFGGWSEDAPGRLAYVTFYPNVMRDIVRPGNVCLELMARARWCDDQVFSVVRSPADGATAFVWSHIARSGSRD
jgi:hypothetical protein